MKLTKIDYLVISFCLIIHYLMFDRYFLNNTATLSGDTQLYWSLEYLLFYSIKNFNEFLWWDPTGLNGYQSFLILLNNYNYTNIFQITYLLIFKLLSLFIDININFWLNLQKTIYYFACNLVILFLISKRLIKSNIAIAFLCLTFTLSQYQFLAMRDAYIVQQLPSALLFLYGFIRFTQTKCKNDFIFLLITVSVFISSTSYSMFLGAFYWIGVFIFSYIIFNKEIMGSLVDQSIKLYANNKLILISLLILILVSILLAFSPVLIDNRNMLRVPGSGPINYINNDFFGPPNYGGGQYQPFSNLMNWVPFTDIHNSVLKFDPWGAGIDHRYLGVLTLPLLGLSILFIGKNKYIVPIFISFFVCSFVIPYTYENGLFSILMEKFFIFQNSRTMPYLLPRDGPSIFIIILASIALDNLINITNDERNKFKIFFYAVLFSSILISLFCLFYLLSNLNPNIRASLAHIGVYLIIYSLLLVNIYGQSDKRKFIACKLLVILILCDLIISSSHYWNRRIVWNPTGAVPQHSYPNPLNVNPLNDPNWMGAYRGIFHNVYTDRPFYGKREWLMLALDPKISNLLTNWNSSSGTEKLLPSIKFYNGGVFQPFENIFDVSKIIKYQNSNNCKKSQDKLTISGIEYKIESGFSGFVESVVNAPDIVKFTGWAIDKDLPAIGVVAFVNGIPWGDIANVNMPRNDIAAGNKNLYYSGFSFAANIKSPIVDLKDRNSVQVFAILKGNKAVELTYSNGYPYNHVDSNITKEINQNCIVDDYFFVHDKSIALEKEKIRRLDAKYVIEKMTFNKLTINAYMPEDGIMVYEDNYSPLWRARVNSSQSSILRTNFTYKVLKLNKGTNIIELSFDPIFTRLLLYIFYFLLILNIFIFVRNRQ